MVEDDGGYEIHNPAIKDVLRSTAKRIVGALPAGWGFLLMLFDYGTDEHPGSTFYISSTERADCVKLLKDWLRRQGDGHGNPEGVSPRAGRELAENMTTEWHKIVAMLMLKYGVKTVNFTSDDVKRLADVPDASVAFGANDDPNVLEIRLVSGDEARQLALKAEAKRHGQR